MSTANGKQATALESKWWYRLLRVILLTTYVLVLVAAQALIYSENQPRHVWDMERSLIVCDGGKSYSFSSIGHGYVLTPLTSSDAEVAQSLCAYGPNEGLVTVKMPDGTRVTGVPYPAVSKSDLMVRYQQSDWLAAHTPKTDSGAMSSPNTVPIPKGAIIGAEFVEFKKLHSYTVQAAFKTEGSWAKTVSYMALAWVAIHLAFVALRVAVLYVAVGRFLPVSGLRGWLTL
jgi:hypothetical protein